MNINIKKITPLLLCGILVTSQAHSMKVPDWAKAAFAAKCIEYAAQSTKYILKKTGEKIVDKSIEQGITIAGSEARKQFKKGCKKGITTTIINSCSGFFNKNTQNVTINTKNKTGFIESAGKEFGKGIVSGATNNTGITIPGIQKVISFGAGACIFGRGAKNLEDKKNRDTAYIQIGIGLTTMALSNAAIDYINDNKKATSQQKVNK